MRYRQTGSSLLELGSVVAILAIMVSSAVPMMDRYFEKQRLISATEGVCSTLQKARTEAIARSRDTFVRFVIDGSEEWSYGTSMTTGCDPDAAPGASDACYVVIDNGDGVLDTADYVTQTEDSQAYQGIRITNVTFGSGEAKFDYVRGTAKAGSVKLESNNYRLKVVTSLMGRIRVCSPSGEYHVAGYPSTSCSW